MALEMTAMGAMEAKQRAIQAATRWSERQQDQDGVKQAGGKIDEIFGQDVFSQRVMRKRLPKDIYKRLIRTTEFGEALDLHVADVVAADMKDWAVENGATHYTH